MLTVSDGWDSIASDIVIVTVTNGVPNANAGAYQSRSKDAPVTPDGSASMDPDGDPLSYRWRQVTGPSKILVGATNETATFTPTTSGTYAFSPTVDDDERNSSASYDSVGGRETSAAEGVRLHAPSLVGENGNRVRDHGDFHTARPR